jgi:membrane-bound serine protease (ClpP class)
MAPGTNIGAAHPVGVTGAIEQEKVTNDAAAFIRALAQRWHRNAAWAESSVRRATSASAQEARRMRVVDLVEPNVRSLLDDVGRCGAHARPPSTGAGSARSYSPPVCGASVAPFGMSITETLFHSFADPNVAFLLLNIGFVALIVWIFHPGFHLSLALAVISMVLGFLILETLPVRLAGIILLLVAAVLFVLDVKARAHGALTAGGIGVMVLGGLVLFNPSEPSARVSLPLLIVTAASLGLLATVTVRALIKARRQPIQVGAEALRGDVGVADTDVGGSGRVRAHGQLWSARSVAGPITAGAAVRIVDVKGLTLEVSPEPGARDAPATPKGT